MLDEQSFFRARYYFEGNRMGKELTDFGALALALWDEYRDELPDSPGRMTARLLKNLRARGFDLIDHQYKDDNPNGAVERESDYKGRNL